MALVIKETSDANEQPQDGTIKTGNILGHPQSFGTYGNVEANTY